MSSKPKRDGITELQTTSAEAEAEKVSVGSSARDEEIRRRAYEIYLERGEHPGYELDDWLQAERELEQGAFRRAQAAAADYTQAHRRVHHVGRIAVRACAHHGTSIKRFSTSVPSMAKNCG
jgi:hypothetical protein